MPIKFVAVPQKLLHLYLDGRAREPGIRHATGINTGKKYPYSSKRQNERHAKKPSQPEAAASKPQE